MTVELCEVLGVVRRVGTCVEVCPETLEVVAATEDVD